VALIALGETCPDGPASAACVARDEAENARRDLSAKTCTRLFSGQEVMQTACISSCRSHTSGDGQACAIAFLRSLQQVAAEKPGSGGLIWPVILLCALLGGAAWAALRGRRRARA
jgi:hypothetical protein